MTSFLMAHGAILNTMNRSIMFQYTFYMANAELEKTFPLNVVFFDLVVRPNVAYLAQVVACDQNGRIRHITFRP